MAFLDVIRNFFGPAFVAEPELVVPAPPMEYYIRPLTLEHTSEVLRLNIRCFKNGDNYTRYTFDYLLDRPGTLSYRMVTVAGEMVGFAFVIVNENNAAHLTTIGVAPEHRRRGLAGRLLEHVEASLRNRGVTTLMLEVRVGNIQAQDLYRRHRFTTVQRIGRYYTNGEDCFLMMKPVNFASF